MADYLSRMNFIVLDELCYVIFVQSGGQLQLYLICRLCEHALITMTTNLSLGEGPTVFGDAKMIAALLGRLAYNCDRQR